MPTIGPSWLGLALSQKDAILVRMHFLIYLAATSMRQKLRVQWEVLVNEARSLSPYHGLSFISHLVAVASIEVAIKKQ